MTLFQFYLHKKCDKKEKDGMWHIRNLNWGATI